MDRDMIRRIRPYAGLTSCTVEDTVICRGDAFPGGFVVTGAISRSWRAAGFVLSVLTLSAVMTAVIPAGQAAAGSTWNGLRNEVFGARPIEDGSGLIAIKAPYRPDDVRAVPISIEARLPLDRSVRAVTLIVDENPSPVAATFKFGGERSSIGLATKVRLNQESFVRAVVEDDRGRLSMVSTLVKFAGGQSACSAPPTGDPAEIAASMGKMKLAATPSKVAATQLSQRVRLDIRHPNHTGMALDQMSLLYIPLRVVSKLEVKKGSDRVFEMAGSITLSENPSIEFDFPVGGSEKLAVTMHDSDGAQWRHEFDVGQEEVVALEQEWLAKIAGERQFNARAFAFRAHGVDDVAGGAVGEGHVALDDVVLS